MKLQTIIIATLVLFTFSCKQSNEKKQVDVSVETENSFDNQVADYIQKFPYQETYNYMTKYTGGKVSNLNIWISRQEPILIKAGEDKAVRMNNDTYYKMAFMDFSNGTIKLSSSNGSDERFSSVQLMDDHNTNFKNIIHPKGDYHLYFGETPEGLEGELIKVPSKLAVVIVRVEVKDKNLQEDIIQAKEIWAGITIEGSKITEFPTLDLLSSFDKKVSDKATMLLDSIFKTVPFRLTVASPNQVPKEVSYSYLASGTKGGWGAPVTSHSSYETIFFDNENKTLDGNKGDYTFTTIEPPVDAFWSITVYDTERGGFFHPNAENKYHINNTAVVKNEDGTITFNFKTKCEDGDLNCIEVPANPFDLVARYYLPHNEIRTGEWELPKAILIKE